MTAGVVGDPVRTVEPNDTGPTWTPAAVPTARSTARLFGARAGQIVATQVAVALVVAASGHGPLVVLPAALLAVPLVLIAWLRFRRRWLHEWIRVGLRYLTRQRTLPTGARAAAPTDTTDATWVGLLNLVSPGATALSADVDDDPAAIINDGYGLTVVLELGDPARLLNDVPLLLPTPAGLLPPANPQLPPMRVQLLLSGSPAPGTSAGSSLAATSYRQLSEGRLLARERALLAFRVLRAEGWSNDDLRRALSSAVRKARRRLAPMPARPLGERAALGVLAELAHHTDGQPAREGWQNIRLGPLVQSTFRLRRWPDLRGEAARRLVPRLLALPAAATTVSVSAGPWTAAGTDAVPVELTVRLAADSPVALSTASEALRQLLAAERAVARRLDGEQLPGLATTLPLGSATTGPAAASGAGMAIAGGPGVVLPVTTVDSLELPFGVGGLMLGLNRHGAAITARLFRAEPTRVTLVGGVRAAQLIALRSMAVGARIVVQTARPQFWEPFLRGVNAPGGTIAMIPPSRPVEGPSGSPLRPLLVIVDAGPVVIDSQSAPGWQTTLVVRGDLNAADSDQLTRADLVILQPLRRDEATLVGGALGIVDTASYLTQIRDDMVGLVNGRKLRWARLAATPTESQLIGPLTRHP